MQSPCSSGLDDDPWRPCPPGLNSDPWHPCPSGLNGDPWCHCLSGLHGDLSGHHFFQFSALFPPATPNCTITGILPNSVIHPVQQLNL